MAEHLRPVGDEREVRRLGAHHRLHGHVPCRRRSVRRGDRRDRQHPARGGRGRVDRRIAAQRAVGRAAVDRGDRPRRARRGRRRPRARRAGASRSSGSRCSRPASSRWTRGGAAGSCPTTCPCSAAACSCRRATSCSPIWTASSPSRRRWSRRSCGSRPTRCRARTHSREELQKGAYLRDGVRQVRRAVSCPGLDSS